MVAGFVWATFGRSFFDWGVWLRLASPIFERSIFGAAVPNRSLGATFAPRNQKRRMRMTYPVFFNMSRTLSIGNEGPRAISFALGPIYLLRNPR